MALKTLVAGRFCWFCTSYFCTPTYRGQCDIPMYHKHDATEYSLIGGVGRLYERGAYAFFSHLGRRLFEQGNYSNGALNRVSMVMTSTNEVGGGYTRVLASM